VTQPSVETLQSGEAVDAIRALQSGLSHDFSELRSAEIELTEAILTAHAVTVAGRDRLEDIQRQLIEAITNPVAALDTPAGERQFLLFLRGKVAEIQGIVDAGALTDEDHAKLTRALASGYLLPTAGQAESSGPAAAPPPGAPATDQTAGVMPALGSALGALPQAAQGAVAGPAQGAGGLAGAASPLAGLASGLLERAGEPEVADERAAHEPGHDDPDDTAEPDDAADDPADPDAGVGEHDDTADRDDRPMPPAPEDRPDDGPAQTRPARLL
jgi:Domain of unknown function (DUF4226)